MRVTPSARWSHGMAENIITSPAVDRTNGTQSAIIQRVKRSFPASKNLLIWLNADSRRLFIIPAHGPRAEAGGIETARQPCRIGRRRRAPRARGQAGQNVCPPPGEIFA